MAKLPALIAVMAKFEPRGAGSVENLTRELRRAGLITQGKRGIGAPDMQFSDVTNILFGTVSRQVNQSPEAVEKLRNAVMRAEWTQEENDKMDAFIESLSISNRITDDGTLIKAGHFIDAILEDLTAHGAVLVNNSENTINQIRIELFDPATGRAAVKVIFRPGEKDEVVCKFEEGASDAPYGIQHSAVIPELVPLYLANMMRQAS